MHVLLDANIFTSHLLAFRRDSLISEIVRAGILGKLTLLLPGELLDGLARKMHEKRYLAKRISSAELAELVDILTSVSEIVPRIQEEIPAVTRDLKDDYLLAYAQVGQADYLVTGDADLLALRQVEKTTILTARGFWEIVKSEGEYEEGGLG